MYHRCVAPFYCGGDRSPLFSMNLVEEGLETWLYIELSGLSYPLSNLFIERGYLWKKGDPFWHHHRVSNCLPSWSCELSPLLYFLNETGWGLRGVVWTHHLCPVLLEVDFIYCLVGIERVLNHLKWCHLHEPRKLVHQCGQEDWLHCRDDLFFNCSVHGGDFFEHGLILSETFSYERLLLGGTYLWGVISRVVRWHKFVSRLCHVVLHGHGEHEVSVPASSEVRRHGRYIYDHHKM